MISKRALSLVVVFVAVALPLTAAAQSELRGKDVKLLFSTSQDVADTWGKLHFGATPMRRIRSVKDPGFVVNCCIPREDGSWDIYGHTYQRDWSKEGNWLTKKHEWKLVHATTRDGERFDNLEVLLEPEPGPWTDHTGIAFNPDAEEFLALKCKGHPRGFAIYAYFSPDGRYWTEHTDNPVYTDGDSLGLFWSATAKCFVSTNKTYQAVLKHSPDHGVHHPKFPDGSRGQLQSRRVLSIRWSRNGRLWEPFSWVSELNDVLLPVGMINVPDEHDPPDIEFYRGIGFWYHDRSFMVVLNYAGTALKPNQHGPMVDTRWWFSRDGLGWERPYRTVNALGESFPEVPNITHNPMIIDGKIVFHFGNHLAGMEQDRITYVGARANAEFSTVAFEMPEADLYVNAAAPSPERPFAIRQAYIMVAVHDEGGNVIPGFEREKCLIEDSDRIDLPLKWEGKSALNLAGRTIRLRFCLRSANIYAVTSNRK